MKLIIAGSRDITDYNILLIALTKFDLHKKITQIISGTARGVDQLGELYAKNNDIPIKRMPADWNKYGRSAGYRRNEEMAKVGDACLAIWNGSQGTYHMINLAKQYKLLTYVYDIRREVE